MSDILESLWQVIQDRKEKLPEGSYTAELFSLGMTEIAKKVGEEGVEVGVAALAQSDERVVSEAADLVYHLLVPLASRGLTWGDVEAELERRFGH